MDWTKPTTLLLGRYQPWHRGHTELFKKALQKTGQVLITVRRMPRGEDNPYDWKTVSQNIIDSLEEEGYKYGVEYEISRSANITHVTYGRDVGYIIEQEHLGEEIEAISATDIRNEDSTDH